MQSSTPKTTRRNLVLGLQAYRPHVRSARSNTQAERCPNLCRAPRDIACVQKQKQLVPGSSNNSSSSSSSSSSRRRRSLLLLLLGLPRLLLQILLRMMILPVAAAALVEVVGIRREVATNELSLICTIANIDNVTRVTKLSPLLRTKPGLLFFVLMERQLQVRERCSDRDWDRLHNLNILTLGCMQDAGSKFTRVQSTNLHTQTKKPLHTLLVSL